MESINIGNKTKTIKMGSVDKIEKTHMYDTYNVMGMAPTNGEESMLQQLGITKYSMDCDQGVLSLNYLADILTNIPYFGSTYYKIKWLINRISSQCLVDTGFTKTQLTKEIYDNIVLGDQLEITFDNGSKIYVTPDLSNCELNTTLSGICILGNKWLRGCVINFNTETKRIGIKQITTGFQPTGVQPAGGQPAGGQPAGGQPIGDTGSPAYYNNQGQNWLSFS